MGIVLKSSSAVCESVTCDGMEFVDGEKKTDEDEDDAKKGMKCHVPKDGKEKQTGPHENQEGT